MDLCRASVSGLDVQLMSQPIKSLKVDPGSSLGFEKIGRRVRFLQRFLNNSSISLSIIFLNK